MKINKILSVLFASAVLFTTSCRNDDTPEFIEEGTVSGYFIANEGNFGKPNAEVSFVSSDLKYVSNDIYAASNNGEVLGDVLQDIALGSDYAYLVLNNTQKIKVVDKKNFKKVGEISTEIKFPRYAVELDSKLYVTNNKAVSIYDAKSLAFIKKIELGKTAERIVVQNKTIFVQNASYGYGTDITLIDPTTNTVKSTFTAPSGQIQKIIKDGNSVYTITSDANDANSYIYQISDAGSVTKTTTLTGISKAANLCIDAGNFFFTSGTKIYKMDKNATSTPTTPIATASESAPFSGLYGFNVIDSKIFTADANKFTQASTVTVYNSNGEIIKTFDTGIGTNGFFKN